MLKAASTTLISILGAMLLSGCETRERADARKVYAIMTKAAELDLRARQGDRAAATEGKRVKGELLALSDELMLKYPSAAEQAALNAEFSKFEKNSKMLQTARGQAERNMVASNAAQLWAAAEQFYIENNRTTASLQDLVGPDKYLKVLRVWFGESYPQHFTQGSPIIVTGLPGGQTYKYDP